MGWFDPKNVPGGSDEDVTLPVSRENQETNMWCWAASGQMIMAYHGQNIAQCVQANNRFGKSTCCQFPVPGDCVQGGWPEFDKYGFRFDRTFSAALSWNQIVNQIGNQATPFAFTWAWTGGGGHMMVCYGYAVINGERWVYIHDPWPPNVGDTRMITYDAYCSGVNYTHWDDFYNVQLSLNPGGPGSMNDDVPGQSEALSAAAVEAAKAIPALRKVIKESAPGSANEEIAMGNGITISFLRLDELKNAAQGPGSDDLAASLLERKPSQVVYPVMDSSKQVQAEIVVSESGKTWRHSSLGSPVLTRLIDKASNAPGNATARHAVLSVPALNQQFLVQATGNEKMYVPLIEDRIAGFSTSDRLSAGELLQRLTRAAAAHNNLPR